MPVIVWTPSADAHLREHWLKQSAQKIGNDLHMSQRAVRNRAKALGLPRASDNPELLSSIRRKAGQATAAKRWGTQPPAEVGQPPPAAAGADVLSSEEAQIRAATIALGEAIRGMYARRGWEPFSYRGAT